VPERKNGTSQFVEIDFLLEKHAVVNYDCVLEESVLREIIIGQQFASSWELALYELYVFVFLECADVFLVTVVVDHHDFEQVFWVKTADTADTFVPIRVRFGAANMSCYDESIFGSWYWYWSLELVLSLVLSLDFDH